MGTSKARVFCCINILERQFFSDLLLSWKAADDFRLPVTDLRLLRLVLQAAFFS